MSATPSRKLFGTDGIRAVAGQYPLDRSTVYACGLALGHSLARETASPRVLIGRDTRESGPWIASLLAAGLRHSGTQVESAGIVPTPAVAFLTRKHGFHSGVVISASHNPWADNGIKLFGADGFKLADRVELAIEDEILRHAASTEPPAASAVPAVEDNPSFAADYIEFLLSCVPSLDLSRLRIVADCANGAASEIAKTLFGRLCPGSASAAQPARPSCKPEFDNFLHQLGNPNQSFVTLLHVEPDGRNINDGCGALHPKHVAS